MAETTTMKVLAGFDDDKRSVESRVKSMRKWLGIGMCTWSLAVFLTVRTPGFHCAVDEWCLCESRSRHNLHCHCRRSNANETLTIILHQFENCCGELGIATKLLCKSKTLPFVRYTCQNIGIETKIIFCDLLYIQEWWFSYIRLLNVSHKIAVKWATRYYNDKELLK